MCKRLRALPRRCRGSPPFPRKGPIDPGDPIIFEDLETDDVGPVIDLLVENGVSPAGANRYAVAAVKENAVTTVHELDGRAWPL